MGHKTHKLMCRAALLATLILTLPVCSCSQNDASVIRLGAPEGAGGLLVDYAIYLGQDTALITQFNYEAYDFQDCCSSNAQFALSSLGVDAAVVCVDAAESLIAADSRFTIVGPCIANSVLAVVRDTSIIRTIGIAQGRLYQTEIVKSLFGDECQTVSMSPLALGAAYESGQVDGVITDVEEATHLSGTRIAVADGEHDVITYMLVARKDLPELEYLAELFGGAATLLNNADELQAAIDKFGTYETNGEELGNG
jgi:hypothetical protein